MSEPSAEGVAEKLKAMIRAIHAGADKEKLVADFRGLLERVDASQIADIERRLVEEGMPEEEIKRLCDVHAAVFRGAEEQQVRLDLGRTHPLAGLRDENREITAIAGELRGLLGQLGEPPSRAAFDDARGDFETALARLDLLEKHYRRKEYVLFPLLERRGGETPAKVMWAVHDDVRRLLKRSKEAVRSGDLSALRAALPELLRQAVEMTFKEEQILFPLCLELFQPEDWESFAGDGEEQARAAGGAEAGRAEPAAGASAGGQTREEGGMLSVETGLISLEQLNLVFSRLPFDVSYVDEHDRVRFYSEGRRIFPRAPQVIGRKVQNCHPPKSVAVVERILDAFRAGERDEAEFWLELGERFVHIQYLALRDAAGKYRGVLEVTQDATHVRGLTGQRRLLDW